MAVRGDPEGTAGAGCSWLPRGAGVIGQMAGPSDWVLASDGTGSGPVYESACTSCLDGSGPADGEHVPVVWCLRHAGRTGHTVHRRIVTDFRRATDRRRERPGLGW